MSSAPMLNVRRFADTPLRREPFDFVVVSDFLHAAAKADLARDFPRIGQPGSFPVSEISYGPAFEALLTELRGPALAAAMSEKFDVDLSAYPTLVTVRGRCHRRDGRVHTDAKWKLLSVLVYLDDGWESPGGRLRLLRSDDLDGVATEVPADWGMLIAFRRSDRSFHGHKPFEGRVVQLNWATDARMIAAEEARHRRSAWWKRLWPAATRAGY